MIVARVPPRAFIVPMIAVCSATRVVTVLMIRSAVSNSATSESTRRMVKKPSTVAVPNGVASVV